MCLLAKILVLIHLQVLGHDMAAGPGGTLLVVPVTVLSTGAVGVSAFRSFIRSK